jgi:hypothetical protein
MEPKFKVGDKVIVNNDFETIIDFVVVDTEHEDTVLYGFKNIIGEKSAAFEEDIKLTEE